VAEMFQVLSVMAVPVAAMWAMRCMVKRQDRAAAETHNAGVADRQSAVRRA
jgi:hypothetical protein